MQNPTTDIPEMIKELNRVQLPTSLMESFDTWREAGMSIMMLTLLAFPGMEDILQMNARTSFLSLCTNGVASALFAVAQMVVWSYVVVMMAAALAGSYAAAGVARRIGRVMVRRFVIAVGLTIAAVLFVKIF